MVAKQSLVTEKTFQSTTEKKTLSNLKIHIPSTHRFAGFMNEHPMVVVHHIAFPGNICQKTKTCLDFQITSRDIPLETSQKGHPATLQNPKKADF